MASRAALCYAMPSESSGSRHHEDDMTTKSIDLAAELQRQRDLTSLFEGRYNAVHGENLNLQLTIIQLRREIEDLTAQLQEPVVTTETVLENPAPRRRAAK